MSTPTIDTLTAIPHVVGGVRIEADGRTGPVFNPATGAQTGEVPLASAAFVHEAALTAQAAQPAWRETGLGKRQQVMFRLREIIAQRAEELARIITAEHGKTVPDALGEVTRGLENVEFCTSLMHHLKGEYSEQVAGGIDVHQVRQPIGVVACITPFNFPAMVPLWMVTTAIAAGNAVILKPSERDPSAANWIADAFAEAGLPAGILNVVHGDKEAVDAILDDEIIRAVSFVGSTPIAKYIYTRAAENGKRVQALGGAKNHMIVMPDADLDSAADAAISAGYGSAGERCMAVSVVVAVGEVADDLVAKIAERMPAVTVGDGTAPGIEMGPLITRDALARVTGFVAGAEAEGARVVVDGRELEVPGDGFFIGPSLVDEVAPGMRVYDEEIFGPVLSVIPYDDEPDAIRIANDSQYGLSMAVWTQSLKTAFEMAEGLQAGAVNVNAGTSDWEINGPFGGFKQSGIGRELGEDGLRAFTNVKTISIHPR